MLWAYVSKDALISKTEGSIQLIVEIVSFITSISTILREDIIVVAILICIIIT